jgi:hypothetical protein
MRGASPQPLLNWRAVDVQIGLLEAAQFCKFIEVEDL